MLLISVFKLPKPIKTNRNLIPKIKWRSLKEPPGNLFIMELAENLSSIDTTDMTTNEMWENFENICLSKAETNFGRTRNKKGPNKETEWWNQNVKAAVAAKKDAFKVWQLSGNAKDLEIYKKSKKHAKKQVALAIAEAYSDFYNRLESAETEADIHKITKIRHNNIKDVTSVKYINDNNNKLLTSDDDIKDRWTEYYNHLLNVFHNRKNVYLRPDVSLGPLADVTPEEIKRAVKETKNNKAPGPDEIPTEVWKSLGKQGVT